MVMPLHDHFELQTSCPTVRRPVLVHVPHAGTAIDEVIRARFIASPEEIDEDLARSTDHAVDQLWEDTVDRGAVMAVNRASRLMCDVERYANDAVEPCAASGRGAIYTKTCNGAPLRAPGMTRLEHETLIAYFYTPWQDMIADIVDYHLGDRGYPYYTIIDAHSFPNTPLPCELDPDPDVRPDICLGWDERHTPQGFRRPLVEFFESHGLSVMENRPFAGSFVPGRHWLRDWRVRSLMVEVNRDLYWDEGGGELDAGGADRMKGVLVEAFLLVDALTSEEKREAKSS